MIYVGWLAENVLIVREGCSLSDRRVSMSPVHRYLRYGLYAVVTAGAHIAELDSTSMAMSKFSAIADAGSIRCFKIHLVTQVSSHRDFCLPCDCLAVIGGESFCRLNIESAHADIQNSLQLPDHFSFLPLLFQAYFHLVVHPRMGCSTFRAKALWCVDGAGCLQAGSWLDSKMGVIY